MEVWEYTRAQTQWKLFNNITLSQLPLQFLIQYSNCVIFNWYYSWCKLNSNKIISWQRHASMSKWECKFTKAPVLCLCITICKWAAVLLTFLTIKRNPSFANKSQFWHFKFTSMSSNWTEYEVDALFWAISLLCKSRAASKQQKCISLIL